MINYILGSVELCIKDNKAISLLASNNVSCSNISFQEDNVCVTIPLYLFIKSKKLLLKYNIEFKVVKISGLPFKIYSFRKRLGLLIGLLVFFFTVSVSGNYIWYFNISGNSVVSDDEILSVLESLDCHIGSKIDDINFKELHNSFLIKCSDIAWISINMDGVVANVEVKETKRGSNEDNANNNNIVASENGQIELITIISGRPQVEIGDVVKEGDLLISGVESYREGENTFYKNADGRIIAKVNKILHVDVNEKKEIRIRTGNETERKSVKIFNLGINLFRKGGIPYNEYDIITENRQIVLFGIIELPMWVCTECICEVDTDFITLSEDELKIEALKIYKGLLSDLSENSELVSIKTKSSFQNGVYSIMGNVYCLTDIAKKVPYEITQ